MKEPYHGERRPPHPKAFQTAADPYLRPASSRSETARAALLWNLTCALLYRPSPRLFHAWRAFLLRCFGATLGPGCHFYPASRVWAPWNLICADSVGASPTGAENPNPAPIPPRLPRHPLPGRSTPAAPRTTTTRLLFPSPRLLTPMRPRATPTSLGLRPRLCRSRSQLSAKAPSSASAPSPPAPSPPGPSTPASPPSTSKTANEFSPTHTKHLPIAYQAWTILFERARTTRCRASIQPHSPSSRLNSQQAP